MKRDGNILVIEPNHGLLTSLGILLKKHFEKVQTTHNLDRAEEFLAKDSFDVLLMDLDIFSKSSEAAETVSTFRQKNPGLEVVLLSTFAQVPMAAQCINCGAFDFVHKPWNEYKIVISLNNAVTRKGYRSKIAELEDEIEKLRSEAKAVGTDGIAEERNANAPLNGLRPTGTAPGNSSIAFENYDIFSNTPGSVYDETLEAIEQRIIKNVMLRNRGNISLTAQQLGITRQTLYNKLKKSNN